MSSWLIKWSQFSSHSGWEFSGLETSSTEDTFAGVRRTWMQLWRSFFRLCILTCSVCPPSWPTNRMKWKTNECVSRLLVDFIQTDDVLVKAEGKAPSVVTHLWVQHLFSQDLNHFLWGGVELQWQRRSGAVWWFHPPLVLSVRQWESLVWAFEPTTFHSPVGRSTTESTEFVATSL